MSFGNKMAKHKKRFIEEKELFDEEKRFSEERREDEKDENVVVMWPLMQEAVFEVVAKHYRFVCC